MAKKKKIGYAIVLSCGTVFNNKIYNSTVSANNAMEQRNEAIVYSIKKIYLEQ